MKNLTPRGAWLLLLAFFVAAAASPARGAQKAPIRKCKRNLIGVPAPRLTSPQDVADHLRRKVNFRLWWHHRVITSLWGTPMKNIGIFGWTDYCTEACGIGKVLQVARARHGFYTVDMELSEFAVQGQPTRLDGRRFIRVEMHGKPTKESLRLPQEGDAVRICGKLMWDADGFLEIHPRTGGDVQLASPVQETPAKTTDSPPAN